MEGQAPRQSALRTAIVSLATAAIAAVVGFAAVYVTVGRSDNGTPAAQTVAQGQTAPAPVAPQELPKGPGVNALSQGQMAAFVFRKEPEALPAFKFQDAEGKERTLADWRGKEIGRAHV